MDTEGAEGHKDRGRAPRLHLAHQAWVACPELDRHPEGVQTPEQGCQSRGTPRPSLLSQWAPRAPTVHWLRG